MTIRVEDVLGTDIVNGGRSVLVRVKSESLGVGAQEADDVANGEFEMEIPAHLLQRFMPSSHGVFRFPEAWQVGDSNQHRGMVAIIFDGETPTEMIFLLHNQQGLVLARELKKNIMPRLTDEERVRAIADEQRIEAVPRPRLILPPGH